MTQISFPALAAHARREIAAYNFRPRQLSILHLIVRHSFDLGRDFAFFQNLAQIGALAGAISKGNVSEIVRHLAKSDVLRVESGLGRYYLQLDSSRWIGIASHYSPAQLAGARRMESMLLGLADRPPEQLHLIEPLPNLNACIAIEDAIIISTTSQGYAAPRPGDATGAHTRGPAGSPRGGDTEPSSGDRPASGPRGDEDASVTAPPSGGGSAALLDRASVNEAIRVSLAQADTRIASHSVTQVPNLGTAFPKNDVSSSQIRNQTVPKLGTKFPETAVSGSQIGNPALRTRARQSDSQNTDLTDQTVSSTADRRALLASKSTPKRADPEIMGILKEIYDAECPGLWEARDAKGKGRWGALWCTSLKSSNLAAAAARKAITAYKDKKHSGEPFEKNPPAWLYTTFKEKHVDALRKRRVS